MRFNRRGAVGAIVLALVLVAGACGDDSGDSTKTNASGDNSTSTSAAAKANGTCAQQKGSGPITVGGTNFSEQEIVAEIYAQCLSAAGYDVATKLKIGSREIVYPAIKSGQIDLYPEYVGTLLTFLKGQPTNDLNATVTALKEKLQPDGVTVLKPSSAEDKNGFAVTKATADKYKLKTLSDLKPVANQLVFGGGPECPERPLCLKGLKDTYGLEFKDVKRLDSGGPLTKDALEKGDIQVGLIFTSDGAVSARGFVVLEDDKHLQPAENVVPAIRVDKNKPPIDSLLDAISAKLTTEELSDLNKKVDIDKADPADVARDWLKEYGFTK